MKMKIACKLLCISPENKLISDKTNYFENGIKATYSLNCVLYNVCQTWQLLAEGTCIVGEKYA